MSIKRSFKKLTVWYEGLNIFRKLIYLYLLCAVLPMAVMISYYYFNTSALLLNKTCKEMNQNIISAENALNTILQPYKTILESLKNSQDLNILLGTDYNDNSYADLAYYMQTNVDAVSDTNPYIKGIHFYSNNRSLPGDGYYFYADENLGQKLLSKLTDCQGNTLLTLKTESRKMGRLSLLSQMNYYATAGLENYVELEVDASYIRGQLYQEDPDYRLYLLGEDGTVILSSDGEMEGQSMKNVLLDWQSTKEDQVVTKTFADEKDYLCIKADMDMDTTLFLQVDRNSRIRAARIAPLRISICFMILSMFLMGILVWQSNRIEQRLERIRFVLDRIGSGDFTQYIETRGANEFGQIETAINQMNTRIDGLIKDNYEKQLEVKSSELNLLQEQINPHFLYNALGVISSLSIREKGKQTVKSIQYLADFYRISLNKGRKVIHVGEEIELLKNYMKIQMLRFSDLVEIEYQVDPMIEECYCIKLLLQPLVENAIHHAREEELFLHILVKAYAKEARVCFDVIDDGMGIPAKKLLILQKELSSQESGFGLKNVDKRIKLAYGQAYGLSIFSIPRPDKSRMQSEDTAYGTHIHIEIPMQVRAEEGRAHE